MKTSCGSGWSLRSAAAALAGPLLALAASAGSAPAGRPEGPPPMPARGVLPLEPVAVTERADSVMALAASPWAPVFAVGSSRQVFLYHAETLELLGVLPFPEGVPYGLRFSRNGALLLAGGGRGGASGGVVAWSVADGTRVIETGDEPDAVLSADLRADRSAVALGGTDRIVKVVSAADRSRLHELKKHADWVTAVAYSPDGALLASGDRAGVAVVWDAATGRELHTLAGHQGAVADLAWRGDSAVLATAGEDGTVRLWNAADGAPVKAWPAHKEGVLSVDFAPDGRMATCGRDCVVRIWTDDGVGERVIKDFADLPLRAAFALEGRRLLIGDWTGAIRVVETADGTKVGVVPANPRPVAQRIEEASAELPAVRAEHAKLVVAAAKAGRTAAAAEAAAAQAAQADREAAAALAEAETAVTQSSSVVTQAVAAHAAYVEATETVEARHAAAVDAQRQAEAALKSARAAVPAAEAEVPARRKAVEAADAALAAARAADADGAAKRAVATESAARAKESAGRVTASQQQLAAARAEVERRAGAMTAATNDAMRAEAQTALNAAREAMQAAETATVAAQQAEVQANAAAAAAAAAAQAAPAETMTKQALHAAGEAARMAAEALGAVEARIAAARVAIGPCEATAARAVEATASAAGLRDEARKQKQASEAALAKARAAAGEAVKRRDAVAAAKAATGPVAVATAREAEEARQAAGAAVAARDAAAARIESLEQGLLTLKAAQLDSILGTVAARVSSQGADPGGLTRRIEFARAAAGRIQIPKPPPPPVPRKEPNAILDLLGRHHLVVLHFPIALLFAALLFEGIWWWRQVTWASHGAFLLLHLGSFSAVVAAGLGWMFAAVGAYDAALLDPHRWMGTAAAAASVVAVFLRGGRRPPHALYPVSLFATVVCTVLAGHLGGAVTHGKGHLTKPMPRVIAAITGRASPAPKPADVFAETVRPILEKHCLQCHGGEHPAGGYALDRKAGAFQGVTAGTAGIVPGDPAQSELARRILLPPEHPDAMPPPGRPAVNAAETLSIVHWIQQGAPWADER